MSYNVFFRSLFLASLFLSGCAQPKYVKAAVSDNIGAPNSG